MGRRAACRSRSALAGRGGGQLRLELVISYHSNDFAEAQDALRLLAAAAALCGAARHAAAAAAAAAAEDCLAGIDPGLPGCSPRASCSRSSQPQHV